MINGRSARIARHFTNGGNQMKKVDLWLIVPSAILPYLMLLCVSLIYFSTKLPLFSQNMEVVFDNNALLVLLLFAFCILFAFILSGVFFLLSIKNQWEPLVLAKTAMIVKLFQIPAYTAIFILGLLCMISNFTFAATVLFAVFDFICLMLTGLISSGAVINTIKTQKLSKKTCFFVLASQLIFCVDVIATVYLYKQIKKET